MALAAVGLLLLLGVVSIAKPRAHWLRRVDPGTDEMVATAPKDAPAALGLGAQRVADAASNVDGTAPAATLSDEFTAGSGFRMPADAMLVRSGVATLEVDALAPALDRAHQLAARLGGFVAATDARAGASQPRIASLELRVPAARFDELAQGLGAIGRLEHVQISTEDVGEEYTDVAARVANGRRMEGRLLDLLASRTGRLQDALTVERELARVREEVERYEARLRYLQARTAMSRVTLSLHEPVPVLSDVGPSPLRDAARQAWRNFIELVALAIASLGVVAPAGMLAAGAWWLWRRRRPALI
jgi:hypothetical protein